MPNNNDNNNNDNNWMNHPGLSGIDPAKLAMLQSLADQGNQKSQNDMLSFLMAAASKNKSDGMQFTKKEMETVIEVMKMGKSPAEVAKMNKMIQMLKLIQ